MKKLIILFICCINFIFIQAQNTDSLHLEKRIYNLEQQVNTLNNMFSIINKNQTINFSILKERNKISKTLMFIGYSLLTAGFIKFNYDQNKIKKNYTYKPNDSFEFLTYSGGVFLTAALILDIDNLKWVTNQHRHNNKIKIKP